MADVASNKLQRQFRANNKKPGTKPVFFICGRVSRCALVLTFGMAFLISLEQRPLEGPTTLSVSATAPTALIPAE